MKATLALPLCVALLLGTCLTAAGNEAGANPLGKVLELMDELAAKITKDGEVEMKAYKEYFEWCDEASKNTAFAIKTAKADKSKLEAKIGEFSSTIEVAGSKTEELAAAIATAQSDLKNATSIREKEVADFTASEAELMEVIDALGRAMGILEKEMAKNPASFAQVDASHVPGVLQTLGVVLDAAAFPASDQKKLTAFVQSQQTEDSDDEEFGAPAATVYKSKSSGIVDVLEDMKEKAEGQLSELRKAEADGKHNYKMLKQSLEDQAAADTKDMEEEKADKAAAVEAKATAEGELSVTTKELASSQEALATTQSTCMQVAADHEATVAARKEELKVIAEAKKILEDSTSGAASQTYSLLQVAAKQGSQIRSRGAVGARVAVLVKHLAQRHHSSALAQLASRIAAVVRRSASSSDGPFTKVKGLIQDMIAKLEKEAEEEATEKAYCDEEMAKTKEKKGELEDDAAKMTAKIDQATAKSTELKGQVKELEAELAALAKEQAEMDKIRKETHDDYVTAKADLEQGLNGIRKALSVLRDYYGSSSAAMLQDDAQFSAFMQQPAAPEKFSKATGAGGGIIGILEVCESDFATNLAKVEAEESDAQADYEKVTQENKVTKAAKSQDIKYKAQEAKSLDTTISELSGDRESVSSELSAVLEYYGKLKERCIAKPETYEERKQRRAAEIAGLKEALRVLEDEAAFVQRKRRGRNFRGSALLAAQA